MVFCVPPGSARRFAQHQPARRMRLAAAGEGAVHRHGLALEEGGRIEGDVFIVKPGREGL